MADTHHAAVLDEHGRLLWTRSCAVSASGYRQLLGWLGAFGEIDRVGVESTGSYVVALTRHLTAEDVRVCEINQPHPHTAATRQDRCDRPWSWPLVTS
jgi:transposase